MTEIVVIGNAVIAVAVLTALGFAAICWILWQQSHHIERLAHSMATTRDQLDAQINALPDTIATTTIATLGPLLKPIADALNAHPADFTAESAILATMPKVLGDSIAKAVTDALSTPPPVTAGDGTAGTPTPTPPAINTG